MKLFSKFLKEQQIANENQKDTKEDTNNKELQDFTNKMKQKMAEQGLSYMDLANINLNKATAEVREEISKMEDRIEALKIKGNDDERAVYPFIKRSQEIIKKKTEKLNKLHKDYEVSTDLCASAKELDSLEAYNRGIKSLFQVSNEMCLLYNKLAATLQFLAKHDGLVNMVYASICNQFYTVVVNLNYNIKLLRPKNKSDLESRFFKAFKRDDEIFNNKMSVIGSLNEYQTILEEPTEAITRSELEAYEKEWDRIQQIIKKEELIQQKTKKAEDAQVRKNQKKKNSLNINKR